MTGRHVMKGMGLYWVGRLTYRSGGMSEVEDITNMRKKWIREGRNNEGKKYQEERV